MPDDAATLKARIDRTGLFPSALLDGMMAGYLRGDGGEGSWLTLDDGGPQALAYYEPERMTQGTWNLLLLAVHPDRQGQGLGRALLRHVERELAVRGGRVLLIETSGDPGLERARSFYLGNGYEVEARIRDFYAPGDDKVVFWKALRSAGLP